MWLSHLLIVTLCSASLSIDEAKTIFSKYVEAIRAGNQEQAISYWNQEEKDRYDPRYLDWQLTHLTWKKDISEFTEEIVSARKTEDYIELVVKWHDSQNKLVRADIRYFILEDSKLVCANPIKVHTVGWLKKELKHIIYHVKKEEEPVPSVLTRIDKFCNRVSKLLGVSLVRKIDCYKCSDHNELAKLVGLPQPALGRAYWPGYVVLCVTHQPEYEIMHIIRKAIKKKGTVTLLYRGLGHYFGGGPYFSPCLMTHWAIQLMEIGEIALAEINYYRAEPNNISACLSGYFVKFLIEEHGIDKFKELYNRADDWAKFEHSVKNIYGKDLPQLEREWKDWKFELETIEPGLSKAAKEVFSLEDPEYDDVGDGDYIYPLGGEEGIFDLTGFKVLADEDRAYFELTYRKLVEGATVPRTKKLTCSDWGFKDSFTKILISTGEELKESELILGYEPENKVYVSEPFNYAIDVSGSGILLRDAYGIWLDILRVKIDNRGIRYGNKIRFSIPISIIGKPTSAWKYAVLVGCHTGHEWMSHGVGRFRTVGKKVSEEQGGGGLDSNVNPNVYDILLPKGEDQAKILGDYNEATGKLVTIPLVGKE